MSSKSDILVVGDLVRLKQSIYAPFYARPELGMIGIVLEVDHNDLLGVLYYVQTRDGVWRFADYELELIDGSR